MIALALDVAIAILLAITLIGGYRLYKKLQLFRTDAQAFEPLIQSLDQAAKRAEKVLGDLRQIADDVSGKLAAETDNTQRLVDELDFMTKRADQLADKLDNAITSARQQEKKQTNTKPTVSTDSPSEVLEVQRQQQRRRAPDLEKRLKTLR